MRPMKKPSYIFLSLFCFLVLGLMAQIGYMYSFKQGDLKSTQEFVKLSGLPDLALANEALFVRFRSLSDIFSLFSNSPELREYFPSTFVYAPSKNQNTSRIELEK